MIEIVTAKRSKNGLHVKYRVEGKEHSSDFIYNSINFYQLEKEVGSVFVQRLFFHIVAFDVMKFVTSDTSRVMWGPFFGYVGTSFIDLWERETKFAAKWRPQPYHPPTAIVTNGAVPLHINGDEPAFTISGRVKKAKDNQHHVQVKTSKKHSSDTLTLFLSLPVAAAYGLSMVTPETPLPEIKQYIHTALTPDITVS